MGRPIATTLRTLAQLRAIVLATPFPKLAQDIERQPKNLCVTFLSHAPSRAELAPLHAGDWAPDRFEVVGQEIYSWHPNGQGKSALALALGKLPVEGTLTTRNWNTVTNLLQLLSADQG